MTFDEPRYHLYLNKQIGYQIDCRWRSDPKRKKIALKTFDIDTANEKLRVFEKKSVKRLIDWHRNERQKLEILNRETPHQAKNPTLSEVIDWYLNVHGSGTCHWSSKTAVKVTQVLRDLQLFLGRRNVGRIQQLNMRLMQEWVQFMAGYRDPRQNGTHAPRTINGWYKIVRAMLNTAERIGILDKSPIQYWEMLKVRSKRRPKALTESELSTCLTILRESKPDKYPFYLFLALSSWAYSDVANLRIKDINWTERKIEKARIKTGTPMYCPISGEVEQCLRMAIGSRKSNPDDFVFVSTSGKHLTYNAVYTPLVRALKAANFTRKDVGIHTFRYTYGTIAASRGVPINILQRLMGHSDPKVTLKYYTEVYEQDKWKYGVEFHKVISSHLGRETAGNSL